MRLELLLKILIIIESDKTNIQMVLNDSIINFKSKSFLFLIYETRQKSNSYLKQIYQYYKIIESINNLAYEVNFDLKSYNNIKLDLRKLKQLEFKLIALSDKGFDKQFNLLA